MPRYTARWLEIAQEQRDSLPATTRRLIDRWIEELLKDPTGDPHALYYQRFDEWSIPFAFSTDEGFIYYAALLDAQVTVGELVPASSASEGGTHAVRTSAPSSQPHSAS